MILLELVQQLDAEDEGWREDAIVLIDNATSYVGKISKAVIELLAIPVCYGSPYSP